MKTLAALLLSATLASLPALAEDASPRPPANGGNEGEGGKDRERFRKFGDGAQPFDGSHIDRWLQVLKERSPEEFERARKMREENPEEFKKHLHKKVEEMRMKGGWQQPGGNLRERPRVVEALKQLSAEDREWAMQRLVQQPFAGGRGDGFPDFKHLNTPDLQRLEERTREQVRACREAGDDDAKRRTKRELRATLSDIFDQREKLRGESLKMVEDKLTKLRQSLAEQQQNRDTIIDARLEEVLRAEPPRRQP